MDRLESLLTVASLISGFSITVFMFRLQREIHMVERGKPTWIPWADWLVIVAVFLSIATAFLIIAWPGGFDTFVSRYFVERFSSAALAAALIFLAGYVPSICAHYRLWFGQARTGLRSNPEPAERAWVLTAVIIGALVFIWLVSN
jgi:hypothetical protein